MPGREGCRCGQRRQTAVKITWPPIYANSLPKISILAAAPTGDDGGVDPSGRQKPPDASARSQQSRADLPPHAASQLRPFALTSALCVGYVGNPITNLLVDTTGRDSFSILVPALLSDAIAPSCSCITFSTSPPTQQC